MKNPTTPETTLNELEATDVTEMVDLQWFKNRFSDDLEKLSDSRFILSLDEVGLMLDGARDYGASVLVMMTELLWAHCQDVAERYPDMYEHETGADRLDLGCRTTVAARRIIRALDVDDIQNIDTLPADNRKVFDEIRDTMIEEEKWLLAVTGTEWAQARADANYTLAKFQGYDTLAEKWRAIERGDEPHDSDFELAHVFIDELKDGDYDKLLYDEAYLMLKALATAEVASEEFAEALVRSVLRRKTNKGATITSDDLMWCVEMVDISAKLRDESDEALYHHAGIIDSYLLGFEVRSQMIKLIERDQGTIENLLQQDVVLIVRDIANDYNDAFQGITYMWNQSGSVPLQLDVEFLRHEMGDESAIHRYRRMLEERNVRPSTIVIGAHGSPGWFDIGGVKVGPEGKVSLQGSGLVELAMNMKPDKDGNCNIIFESCSQDAPISTEDEDHTTLTAMAAALRQANIERGKDAVTYQIYGARDPFASNKSSACIEYVIGADPSIDAELWYAPVTVQRIIVTPSGNIYRHLRERGDSDEPLNILQLPMFGK